MNLTLNRSLANLAATLCAAVTLLLSSGCDYYKGIDQVEFEAKVFQRNGTSPLTGFSVLSYTTTLDLGEGALQEITIVPAEPTQTNQDGAWTHFIEDAKLRGSQTQTCSETCVFSSLLRGCTQTSITCDSSTPTYNVYEIRRAYSTLSYPIFDMVAQVRSLGYVLPQPLSETDPLTLPLLLAGDNLIWEEMSPYGQWYGRVAPNYWKQKDYFITPYDGQSFAGVGASSQSAQNLPSFEELITDPNYVLKSEMTEAQAAAALALGQTVLMTQEEFQASLDINVQQIIPSNNPSQ